MKKLVFLSVIAYQSFSFAQDTTQVNHTKKITKLIDKVHVINEGNIKNKEQVLNKSKIDGLMLKIETINKEQNKIATSKEYNFDSLQVVIQLLNSNNLQKDSLIATLKKQLEYQKTSNQSNTSVLTKQPNSITHKYIVLGAYRYKSNAEKQVDKLRDYDVEMTYTYLNNLHFVVYKLKSKEKIATTLSKFRNKVEPNAWYIAF
jgi:hypothetical protein